jgi:hypothetical protein
LTPIVFGVSVRLRISFRRFFSDLDPAPRRFLAFSFFNVLSWQCIIGPVLVLFGRKLDMPAAWVGLVTAMVPFSSIVVVGTNNLIMRAGPKRLMLWTWFFRNVLAASIFILPFVLDKWGLRAAWFVFLGSTAAFCLARAVGVGGWFPWLYEVVPTHQRGAFFSSEQTLVQAVNVGLIFGQGLILTDTPTVNRFMVLFGMGIIAGFMSLLFMARVPGGAGMKAERAVASSITAYKSVLRDRRFMVLLSVASLSLFAATFFGASYVMFMRDVMHIPDNRIMYLLAAGAAGVFVAVRKWGRFADRNGSGRAMYKLTLGHGLGSLAFLALVPGTPWCYWALWPLIVWVHIAGSSYWAVIHRAMLNTVEKRNLVAYTNLWMLSTSFVLGVTPIIAGKIIDWRGLAGFHTCFIIAGIGEIVFAYISVLLVRDGIQWRRPGLAFFADPFIAAARMAWISFGMDESNRKRPER